MFRTWRMERLRHTPGKRTCCAARTRRVAFLGWCSRNGSWKQREVVRRRSTSACLECLRWRMIRYRTPAGANCSGITPGGQAFRRKQSSHWTPVKTPGRGRGQTRHDARSRRRGRSGGSGRSRRNGRSDGSGRSPRRRTRGRKDRVRPVQKPHGNHQSTGLALSSQGPRRSSSQGPSRSRPDSSPARSHLPPAGRHRQGPAWGDRGRRVGPALAAGPEGAAGVVVRRTGRGLLCRRGTGLGEVAGWLFSSSRILGQPGSASSETASCRP